MRSEKRVVATATSLVGLVIGMVTLSYAAVPLYDLFCRVTGYGGTPQVAAGMSPALGNRELTVRFNADVNRDLPWEFEPVDGRVVVRVGEPT